MPLATVKYLFCILLLKYELFILKERFMTKAIIGHFFLIVACDNTVCIK